MRLSMVLTGTRKELGTPWAPLHVIRVEYVYVWLLTLQLEDVCP
jgi:hypothetical protein